MTDKAKEYIYFRTLFNKIVFTYNQVVYVQVKLITKLSMYSSNLELSYLNVNGKVSYVTVKCLVQGTKCTHRNKVCQLSNGQYDH